MGKKSDFLIKKVFLGTLSIMILSALTAILGMLIDGVIIRKCLGAESMAAYGIASPVFILLSAISGIFSSGTQTVCARSLGKGDLEKANRYFSTTIITILLLAVVLVPALFASGNLFATLLCAYVFKGGMLGMALATSFSYVVSTIVMLCYFLQGKSTIKFLFKKAELSAIREVIVVGLPSALSRVCMTMRSVMFNWLILTISTQEASSVFAIRSNLNNLYGAVGLGIGMGTLVIGGVVVGEGSRKDTRELLKTSIKYGLLFNSIICVIIILFAKQLVGIYTTDPVEVKLAVPALCLSALGVLLNTVNTIFMNYFQAIKKMKLTHLVCLLDNFVFSCLAAVVLGFAFNINGIWAAFAVGEILMLITIFFLAWKHVGHMPKCLDDFMFLPENFDAVQEDRMEFSCQDMDSVIEASKSVYDFALRKTGNKKKAMLVALSIEELAGNVIRWEFESNKKNVIDIRITYQDQLTLRIRDNCKPFNPKKWQEMHHPSEDDTVSNYGIRMTVQMMKDIQYMSTLNLNTLLIKL